ncbi:hypothetical protein BJ508DRAFT_334429 [Ascobolus immersus RN42]|uniref:Uncharacterized protein n=1 Tax=Ascobolus immersus RN42 TaxID=1160509 RepID=A0A3N4HMK6_ASCIM|nr:hypothetical protein BJ508DRAFT_334429 [Ascobolus immersus RN42]
MQQGPATSYIPFGGKTVYITNNMIFNIFRQTVGAHPRIITRRLNFGDCLVTLAGYVTGKTIWDFAEELFLTKDAGNGGNKGKLLERGLPGNGGKKVEN